MSKCRFRMAMKFFLCQAGKIIVVFVVPFVAAASNLNFMEGAPITFFDKKDQALFNDAVQQTLNGAPDGEERKWANPESGAKGELTVVQTFSEGRCRQLRIVNHARGRTGKTTMVFCQQSDKKWTPDSKKTPR